MSFPRYPKYKPSGVDWLGDVPEHWDGSRLSSVTATDRILTMIRGLSK
jgi:type I restriction enzyme S subunit